MLKTALLFVFAAVPALTQDASVRCGHLLDVKSGQYLSNVTVEVKDGRILSVGAGSSRPSIDLSNATCLPGLIDVHDHITGDARMPAYNSLGVSIPRQTLMGAKFARITLRAGFTTIRNVGASGYSDVALRDAVAAGDIEGPRMLVSGPALGITGGHCDDNLLAPEYKHFDEGVADGPWAVRAKVRQNVKYGVDVIKICASGGVFSESDPLKVPQLTPAELDAIIGEAHRWGRKVAAHSHGDEAARLAVEAGVDSIEHGTFLTADTLRLMKQRGTYLVPTRMAAWWSGRHADSYPPPIAKKAHAAATAGAQMMKEALRIGVPIAFGTDSAVSPHGMNAKEFSLLVADGMTPAAALLAATREASRLLGVDAETGSLEAGKAADLVAVRGNVLEDITTTERPILVMARGAVVVQKP